MREHIISITMVALAASVADMLSPCEWKKYIRILLGFLIMFVVISPLSELKGIKIPSIDSDLAENNITLTNDITEELKKNIEADIENRIKDEFGVILTANVVIATDSDNNINGVKKITLNQKNVPDNIIKRLKEVYGCENIQYK